MTLQIRNPRVELLARRLAAMRQTSLTGAVLEALENEIKRGGARMTFEERNAGVMAMADALGASDPAFDMKSFSDEMWGDE